MPAEGGASTDVVGSFQIALAAGDDGMGSTSIIGKVNDGPTPSLVLFSVTDTSGDCILEVPRVPFCNPGCGSKACGDGNQCIAYPTGHVVGDVKITGLHQTDGSTEVALKEAAKRYQPGPGTLFAYPPFADGEDVRLSATGGDYQPFMVSAKGVAPLTLTSTHLILEDNEPLDLTWTPPQAVGNSKVHVTLDVSHHGGTKGMIECDTADTGALTLAAPLVSKLLALGAAGFPTIKVTRSSIGTAAISVGQVQLVVSTLAERAVTIPSQVSCMEDKQCPSGQVCRADLTCG